MGIHLLQTFISSLNDRSIKEQHLRHFTGKTISVDISIYLYRFKEMGNLLENIYLMCSIFRHYNITAIFIFDGKPSKIKNETAQKRRLEKNNARKEFSNLKKEFTKAKYEDKKNIETKMDILRKKFITITKDDIKQTQNLLKSYGMTYITAKREADELCGALNRQVYACLTEDTDIMVFGCTRIFRYFSLMKHTVVVYNMTQIRHNLQMSLSEFQELCVCSGNDYIKSSKNIFCYHKLFKQYKRTSRPSFLDWLLEKRQISLQTYHRYKEIYEFYTFQKYDPFEDVPYTIFKNKSVDKPELMKVLKSINFIFPY
tara:strand:- start:1875 stop:2816 length:942 start_codon:yes stop_codon:yes gene_type:complete